jgi:hypothetical protein
LIFYVRLLRIKIIKVHVDSLPNSWVLEEQLMLGSREELDQLVLASAPPL